MLSRAHKTIFVHIPKTAGQSIETVFLNDLGLDWKSRAPLLMRPNDDRSQGPARLAHLFAREYVECGHVPPKDFAAFFKFSIVRNPYDRAISAYNYWRGQPGGNLRDFIAARHAEEWSEHGRLVCPQHLYVIADGVPAVDEIVRLENLATEWPRLSQRIFGAGDGPARALPRKNISRPSLTRDQLSNDDIAFLNEIYAEDFRLFGYERIAV